MVFIIEIHKLQNSPHAIDRSQPRLFRELNLFGYNFRTEHAVERMQLPFEILSALSVPLSRPALTPQRI